MTPDFVQCSQRIIPQLSAGRHRAHSSCRPSTRLQACWRFLGLAAAASAAAVLLTWIYLPETARADIYH
ncbi:MAG: twin-arginine translocation signal domain-containing protein [Steroidobacteraceae bacterium]